MRVIAGSARRIPLVAPEGKNTRPTTDRIKETLFNMLQDDIPGCQSRSKAGCTGGVWQRSTGVYPEKSGKDKVKRPGSGTAGGSYLWCV